MKRRKLVFSAKAEADLTAIGDFIARDDPRAALKWVKKLIATARAATRTPFGGRRVPELQQEDVREVFLQRYRIVYRVTAHSLEVLTVFEGHKQLAL